MFEHTPGPWIYVGTDPNEGWDGYRIVGESRVGWGDIGTVTGPQSDPSAAADARLIAAAPELLEVLTVLVGGHRTGGTRYVSGDLIAQARAVIAKATGGGDA